MQHCSAACAGQCTDKFRQQRPTCPSHRCVLPEVSAALEDSVGGEEDQQTIRNHACKVDDSIAQVLLVLSAVPVVIATVERCALGPNWYHAYPHLQHSFCLLHMLAWQDQVLARYDSTYLLHCCLQTGGEHMSMASIHHRTLVCA